MNEKQPVRLVTRSIVPEARDELGEDCDPALGESACNDPNAECVGPDGFTTCDCIAGHVNEGGTCKVPEGGWCIMAEECVSNADCDEHMCTCNPGYIPDGSGQCRRQGALDEDCDPLMGALACTDPNAECVDAGAGFTTCQCKAGYVNDAGICSEFPVFQSRILVGLESLLLVTETSMVFRKDFERQGALDEECDPLMGALACLDPNAECIEAGTGFSTCQCKAGHVNDAGICKTLLILVIKTSKMFSKYFGQLVLRMNLREFRCETFGLAMIRPFGFLWTLEK
ncbi:unnamed protein product [Darwinula stevensoni]|uniref:EGF-like domain-containing protein n=1 Tax=Darwinula stevensoni TaxID=69355 RepID=A0A7R9A9M4_9CRUS|nr:unnamed protein product [Darwinula stevensoni]CAG0897562.1 unnamed protein product [Darwinula stevensoni]